jgi:SAM-dependent methyltransferase
MTTPAVTPIALGMRLAVPPHIHPDDFMFHYHLGPDPQESDRRRALEYYFADGARSAAQLDELVVRFHPQQGQRRLSLLEFASGYGCVSRHIAKMTDRYDHLACDIHQQAVDFLPRCLKVPAILSHRDPQALYLPQAFDVIFALSFFTHIRAWSEWMLRLFDALADDGLLIFTTHGRVEHHDGGGPVLDEKGFWFGGTSEQKDLPLEDYRTAIVTPFYVFEQMGQRERASLTLFQESLWWGRQDTYVIRKAPLPFGPPRPDRHALQRNVAALHSAIEAIYASRSWRLSAPIRWIGRWRS